MEQSAESSLEEVRDYWNSNPLHSIEFAQKNINKEYFENIDAMRWGQNELWAQSKFYDFSGSNTTSLLDAGCGIGVFTRFYAKKGFNVTAVDLTEKAVDLTKKSLELYDLSANVKQASVEHLPFEDNSFDYIVSNGVIHHTPGTQKAVEEFYRVLKPKGKASVAVYYKNILLRYPLWPLVRLAIPALLKNYSGREKMFSVQSPEDFVKIYDGNNTPIAKVYSKSQARDLFAKFRILKVEPHYFPIRFLKGFKPGGFTHKILDHTCGCLIYCLLEKPA